VCIYDKKLEIYGKQAQNVNSMQTPTQTGFENLIDFDTQKWREILGFLYGE
jgi:hypothetical protein